MSNAEQLERETEQTRAQIADTLDELRACMTPGRVLDQLADRVSGGAAVAFARNLKDQAVNNPLPIALVGAGLAWLMLSRRQSDGSFIHRPGERLRNAVSDAAENVRNAVDRAGQAASAKGAEWNERASGLSEDASEGLSSTTERAKQAATEATNSVAETVTSMADATQRRAARNADSVRESAASAANSARDTAMQAAESLRGSAGAMSDAMQRTASAGYEAVADSTRRTAGALSESTKAVGNRTLQSGSAFLDFCREQPMVLAGLGLFAGAVIGALLPTSETEDQLMGEVSDRVKEYAGDLASEQYDSAKKVGERALDAAKDEPVKQANEQEKTGDAESQKQAPAGEVKADGPALVPTEQSELERREQPWTTDNAPV